MLEVYIDGASAGDPGPSGAGIFIKSETTHEQHSIPLGMMSNHEAEYWALIHALNICIKKNDPIISIRTDSKLIEQAMEKRFTKNQRFLPLLEHALQLSDQFELFFIKWIPSKSNRAADELAKQAIRKT
ncbi:reverse transcriptase-like protein [Bacillus solimangrovi]|uniref:Ribonuclease HI n=1 Tax=Bacillus solimangrovi TaxID=1305675 RepID=A0A1E5LFL0_9BACI|nr:reverse transcriptase-like protein [Bacillus solimangrovi]OEH92850.1 ribonuclease HI [Bacillus solimangrovi]